jgi:hypothetical protein
MSRSWLDCPAGRGQLIRKPVGSLRWSDEARERQWLGEVSALEDSLRHIRAKKDHVKQQRA